MNRHVSNEVSMKKVKVVINGCGKETYLGMNYLEYDHFQISVYNIGIEWSYQDENTVNYVNIYNSENLNKFYRNIGNFIRVPKVNEDIEYEYGENRQKIRFRREFVIEIPINEEFDPNKLRLITEQCDYKWWRSLLELNYVRYNQKKFIWNENNESSVNYFDGTKYISEINELKFVIREVDPIEELEWNYRMYGVDLYDIIQQSLSK